jgi:hypothetical protein
VVLHWSLFLKLEVEQDLTLSSSTDKSLVVTVDLGVVTIHVEEFTGIVLEEFAILFRLVHEEMGAIHLDRDNSIALNVGRDSFAFEDTRRQVNNRTETLQTGVIIVDKLDHRKNTLVESIDSFLLESLRALMERTVGVFFFFGSVD